MSDTTVVTKMLNADEQRQHNANVRVSLTGKAIATLAAAASVADAGALTTPLFSVAANTIVELKAVALTTAMEDASDAAFNDVAITIGDGSDVDRYLASTQINGNGTEITSAVGLVRFAYTAADTVDIVVGSMTDKNLADLDTGELVLYFEVNPAS